MFHFIEEAFQINIHDVFMTCIDVLLRLKHRLLGIAIRPESVAVFFKLSFKQWHDHLMHRLL